MKDNLLRTFFEWALITSVLMSVGFFGFYVSYSRGTRACNAEIAIAQAGYQKNHAVMALLLSECRDYAKTNADMARLLESARVPSPSTLPAPAPAKPRTR